MSSYIRYTLIPALLALVIFYLTCIVNVDSIPGSGRLLQYDKLAHFGMFFALSSAIYYDYYRLHHRMPNKLKWIFLGLIVPVLYGGLIEVAQENFFGRSGELMDFVADSLGSLTATALAFLFINMKRKQ